MLAALSGARLPVRALSQRWYRVPVAFAYHKMSWLWLLRPRTVLDQRRPVLQVQQDSPSQVIYFIEIISGLIIIIIGRKHESNIFCRSSETVAFPLITHIGLQRCGEWLLCLVPLIDWKILAKITNWQFVRLVLINILLLPPTLRLLVHFTPTCPIFVICIYYCGQPESLWKSPEGHNGDTVSFFPCFNWFLILL